MSARLMPLKRDVMQKFDKVKIPLRKIPLPIYTFIYFGREFCHCSRYSCMVTLGGQKVLNMDK